MHVDSEHEKIKWTWKIASKMKTHKCLTFSPKKKKSTELITQAISNALRKLKCSIPMEEILEIDLNSFNYF